MAMMSASSAAMFLRTSLVRRALGLSEVRAAFRESMFQEINFIGILLQRDFFGHT
jgi:hypothetical protein